MILILSAVCASSPPCLRYTLFVILGIPSLHRLPMEMSPGSPARLGFFLEGSPLSPPLSFVFDANVFGIGQAFARRITFIQLFYQVS